MNKGFTLIELILVIAIISILSGVILFSVSQYLSKGKDSNIKGNLAVLIPAGETFYNIENAAHGDGYNGFCDPSQNSVINNIISSMQKNLSPSPADCSSGLTPGVCCNVAPPYFDKWVACTREFADSSKAYCVDSRGMKEDISDSSCTSSLSQCP